MHTTPLTLLQRLGQSASPEAWRQFVALYTPLLFHWARSRGLQEDDAADLVQDVLVILVQRLPEFQYQPGKSFRGWMRMVLLNKWRDRMAAAAPGQLNGVAEPEAPDGVALLEEEEYRRYVVGRALRLMQTDFEPTTWQACWETVVGERPVAEVAAALGITVNAVYLAKSRVLGQLRRDLAGLLD
jgi:RNA polymerase sigma-70 factor, ECF subfamily